MSEAIVILLENAWHILENHGICLVNPGKSWKNHGISK
jgi:hypothetical protein